MTSVYGSFGAQDRPATAPGGGSNFLKTGHIVDPVVYAASTNVKTGQYASEVDSKAIVDLTRQYRESLDDKGKEKQQLIKVIADAKNILRANSSLKKKRAAHVDRLVLQTRELGLKRREAERESIALRHQLASLLRENEKLALEVEGMTSQFEELAKTHELHAAQSNEVVGVICAYRKEISSQKKIRTDISREVNAEEKMQTVAAIKAKDVNTLKERLKICIADTCTAPTG